MDRTPSIDEQLKKPYIFEPPESTLSLETILSSSTLTASDIPGPGRLVGKYVYSRGGRALEASLARLTHAAGYGPVATAQRIGANLQGFSQDSDMSLESIFANGEDELRLDLGIVSDVERLRKNCRKLFQYTCSNVSATRIQALRMIVMLYVRFPYLSTYFEIPESELLGCEDAPRYSDSLERELEGMAHACVAPVDSARSAARLVDHLAQTTKFGRVLQSTHSSGPGANLPDGELVLKYCTNEQTAFASLRFTALIFRHSFLSRGKEYYVKYNSPVNDFWYCMRDIALHHLSIFRDELISCSTCGPVDSVDWRGIDLFVETILEMLFRAVTWHEMFKLTEQKYELLRQISLPLDSPSARTYLKNATFIANSKLTPFLNSSKDRIFRRDFPADYVR